MSAPAILQSDLSQRVIAAVRDASKPVTFKALAKSLKTKQEPLQAALESAVDANAVFRWGDPRPQYFWHTPLEQKARESILTVAATQALSKLDLSKLAAKGKKLPGFTAKRMESVVAELVAEKQLQAVRGFSGSSKLLMRPGDHEAYFNAGRSFLEKKIRSAGFDPAGFFKEKENAPPQIDAPAVILEAVRSLEPVKGVPVSTLRLRNHLPKLSKGEFDVAALELRKLQKVFLSQHADPYNISQEDKDLLIDGQDGTYYVAIAIR
jgi:hypothetical protein